MSDELVERALEAYALAADLGIMPAEDEEWGEDLMNGMRAALAAARDTIRREALEEAAKVAEEATFPPEEGLNFLELGIVRGGKKAASNIAAAIRALIEKEGND
ncbi:MAG TPA: hypothetical protein VK196_22305 [Magnetospirillum sp.]|nr:hypothetical protein [Magnetospirillum sp.]